MEPNEQAEVGRLLIESKPRLFGSEPNLRGDDGVSRSSSHIPFHFTVDHLLAEYHRRIAEADRDPKLEPHAKVLCFSFSTTFLSGPHSLFSPNVVGASGKPRESRIDITQDDLVSQTRSE